MFFHEIVGQQAIKNKLISDVKSEKVSHAHLFSGNLGYGGLPIALAFSQYLLCENRGEKDSCGQCKSCRLVQKLEHPDLHFSFPTTQVISKTSDPMFSIWKVEALQNPYFNLSQWIELSDEKKRKPIISVDQSQEIIRKLTLKSFEGGYKISILWMAEEMNAQCANKLLKIIEEPPAKTIFILITASDQSILPTILSRTQITKINRVDNSDIEHYLNSKGFSNVDLVKSVVARADGSIGEAIPLIQAGGEENIHHQRFVELMRACYRKNVTDMFKWTDEISKLGVDEQKQFLKYSLYMVRQSIVKNYVEDQLLQVSPKESEFLQNFARFITGNNVTEFYRLFNEAYYNLERNAYGKLLFTNITFEVMRYIHKA